MKSNVVALDALFQASLTGKLSSEDGVAIDATGNAQ
jgi:hypothetical protein